MNALCFTWRMNLPSRSFTMSFTAMTFSVVVGLVCLSQSAANAAPDAPLGAAQAEHADARTVAPPQRLTRKLREDLLVKLYAQLKSAPDEKSAEIIAGAIEKIWHRSGSDTADLLMARANAALQKQDYELAIKILTALTSLAPQYAEGWNQLATVHFLRENYREAVIELRRVLAIDPHHFKAVEGLAVILRETGKKELALKAMRQVLTIYPQLKSAKQAVEELEREVEGQDT